MKIQKEKKLKESRKKGDKENQPRLKTERHKRDRSWMEERQRKQRNPEEDGEKIPTAKQEDKSVNRNSKRVTGEE